MSLQSRSVLVIGDPWPLLEVERDTSLYLLREGIKHFQLRCWWTTPADLFVRDNRLCSRVTPVQFRNEKVIPFPTLKAREKLAALDTFRTLLWRCDPPVTLETHRAWALFDCDPVLNVVNNPRAMSVWNEKFSLLKYAKWSIPSYIVASETALRREFRKLPKKPLIIKPSAAAASYGVARLSRELGTAVRQYQRIEKKYGPFAIIQEIDDRIHELGEFRFFALNGKVVAAVQKFPGSVDPIMNWYTTKEKQPRLQMADPSTDGYALAEKRAKIIARDLKREGVFFASIDFIGERILEINVTSPGLIKWVDEVGRFTVPRPSKLTLAEQFWSRILK